MAFDCYCIDFKNKNSKKNIATIKEKFPYVEVLPFIKNFNHLLKYAAEHSKTSHAWLLSSVCDYSTVDFDFIPEQFEKDQLHVWNVPEQTEGDTFLVTKNFNKQDPKFLRDYRDINYHISDNIKYDNHIDEYYYDLSNAVESLPQTFEPRHQYICYKPKDAETKQVYPSYWDDLKIIRYKDVFYVPKVAIPQIKIDIYDYPYIFNIAKPEQKDCFDTFYISNGEPFEKQNWNDLTNHFKEENLPNRLEWVQGINGRSEAYKETARRSNTEYFYAVFAKSRTHRWFSFDFQVDRAKSKRHYIFQSYLPELKINYGTYNINLYNKTHTLATPDLVLDFTLSKPHEVIPGYASSALLTPDNYTAWKNGFREVAKLVYWYKNKPTVENNFRIKKWLACDHEWLQKGAQEGKKFTEESNYNLDTILNTYSWDFCRAKFKQLYPNEPLY